MIVHGYTSGGAIAATMDGVLMSVPDDMRNGHRQRIAEEWEAQDNVIPPYVPPEVVEPAPEEISDRQFFQELANREIITEEEALAAVMTGTIPAAMQAMIDALPEEQQFPATMLVSGATTFHRRHPLTGLIGILGSWDDAGLDKLWRDAHAL